MAPIIAAEPAHRDGSDLSKSVIAWCLPVFCHNASPRQMNPNAVIGFMVTSVDSIRINHSTPKSHPSSTSSAEAATNAPETLEKRHNHSGSVKKTLSFTPPLSWFDPMQYTAKSPMLVTFWMR